MKVTDGDVWTSDLSIALAVRLLFLSLCPTVQSLPLSVELDLTNGLTVSATLPRSFAVPCNDGSRRAFVDGIVEAPGIAPSPGGTCAASQLITTTTASSSYTFSTVGTRHVVIEQPLRNDGATCRLEVPGSIGMASGTDPFQAVSAINGGNEVCAQGACHYATPRSYTIASGQSLTLVLNASWWFGGTSDTETAPPPCAQAISNVNRAEFPVASGGIQIAWEIVLQQVCSAPASLSFAIEPK